MMAHLRKRDFWIPLILLSLLLIDTVMANVFSPWFIGAQYILVPRLIVIGLVIFSFMTDTSAMFWMTVGIGLMYDSYTTGILGVYTFLFALIVTIMTRMKRQLHINAFTLAVVLVIALFVVESGSYFFYSFLGMTKISWQQFLIKRLSASMILNIVLYYMSYYPLRSFAKWLEG